MPLTLVTNYELPAVKSYEAGSICIGENTYTQSILITPEQIQRDLLPASIADFTEQHWQILEDTNKACDVLILGTGEKIEFPPPAILQRFQQLNLSLEIMDSFAACRTYNILLSEQRLVSAAIMITAN